MKPIDFHVALVATYDATELEMDEIREANQYITEVMMLGGFRLVDKDLRNTDPDTNEYTGVLTFEKDNSHAGIS